MTGDVYRILDRESLPGYLRGIPEVVDILGSDDDFVIEEIGDGNLNFVYLVSSPIDSSRSVIVKQAVPYLRLVGEEWPLNRDRMTFEIRALTLYNEIVPDFVPTIYYADEEMSIVVMQFLDDHIILRQGMIEGIVYPAVGEHLGTFLAETLFRTSKWSMASEERRQLMGQFTLNAELCKLTEEFVFTFPYMEHSSNYSNPDTDAWVNRNIHTDSDYKLDVLKFKDLFVAKADALLHADLHTGSLMVNQTESYVIDMEFAYFGPFGFDIGKVISNLLICCTSHFHRSGGDEYRDWLLEQISVVWKTFEDRFNALWITAGDSTMLIDGLLTPEEFKTLREQFMSDLLEESVGFAACSMARRTIGIAGNADIRDIEDLSIRSKLEIANLRLSKQLMAERSSLSTVDDLLELVRDFYQSPIL